MQLLKSDPVLDLANSYVIDSAQPSDPSYFWCSGSLLTTCLVVQISTGNLLGLLVEALSFGDSLAAFAISVPLSEAPFSHKAAVKLKRMDEDLGQGRFQRAAAIKEERE